MSYNYNYILNYSTRRKKIRIINVILTIALILLICAAVFLVFIIKDMLDYDMKVKEYGKTIEKESAYFKLQEQIAYEKEQKRLRNSKPLTENQISLIENIYSLEGNKKAFLTFDDGPTMSVTPLILDYLKEENIKVTFFVLGNRVKANPDLIKREFEEGHYIANHGYSHVYSKIYAKVENVLEEYNYTENAIQEALENPEYHSRVFRFPGGSVGGYYAKMKTKAKEYLKQKNIAYLDWNALSNDAAGAYTKEALMQNIIETVGEKNNVVILMHDAADKILTYETLPEVVEYLRQKGYTFMNLYDIL